jgi:hypothetical protein
LTKDKVTIVVKNTDVLSKEVKTSILGKHDHKLLVSFEYFMKHGHAFPLSSSTTTTVIQSVTSPGKSTALTSPIPLLTSIATSFEVPSLEVIHIDELTPILPEEMPPSSLFFNKKIKSIIRKESQHKEGAIIKRHKMIYDGQGKNDPEFAKEVVDSLGAFSMCYHSRKLS